MVNSRSFDVDTIAEARKLIDSGLAQSALLTQFRVKWGLSSDDAERLLRIARESKPRSAATIERTAHLREEGTTDLIWGFGALAVGGVITAITWIVAEPGGTYFLFWGPLIYGGYRLIKGFTLKFRTAANTSSVFVWLAAAIFLGAGIAVAGTLAFNAGEVTEPADSHFTWVEDDPVLLDRDTIRFTGEIRNSNDEWSIQAPVLTVSFFNEAGLMVSMLESSLDTGTIAPNTSQRYSTTIDVGREFETYQPQINWDWVID